MFVRYLPLIFVLAALVLALAPLEAAGQSASGPGVSGAGQAQAEVKTEGARKEDQRRPKTAGKKARPPGADAGPVRPAQAFPPERTAPSDIPAPSRGGVRTPDPATTAPAAKDDPRSVEERGDSGGSAA